MSIIPTRIRLLSARICRDNPGDPLNRWANRLPAFARLAELYAPAVLAVQDGGRDQLQALAEKLPSFKLADGHRRWQDDCTYTAVFYRPDVVQLEDSMDAWLSQTPRVRGSVSWGALHPVVATIVELRIRESGQRFVVVSAQLDPEQPRARLEQACVLLGQLNKQNPDRHPLLLMGSFEEDADLGVYRLFTGRRLVRGTTGNLTDVWKRMGKSEENAGTVHGFKGLPRERTDWIMYEGLVEPQEVSRLTSPVDGVFISSHFPLGAEVGI